MILISLWTQTDFRWVFKIIQVYERYDGENKMQIEQHWVILKLFNIFSAKKLETTSTTKKQQNVKNGNVRFRLNNDVRKEMEDSITLVKGRLNFSCKSTTAANVDHTKSLLNNLLKNNHIIADKIYCLPSLFVFFYEF